ncbi:LADA_0B10440g1_1 [Lachancea dasiensis]|uniref:DNA ligase n=1 Tax=Lachancea dasiensis TaxID=1072105 RepID=A0A1G4IVQ2_9SACH|nr:LADA_0B10440g1_1 [Lachancea dasiensis]
MGTIGGDSQSSYSSEANIEPEPKNFAPSPDFRWLCDELFGKLDAINTNKMKYGKAAAVKYIEVIIHFIKLWRTTVGNDFFPVLRLILPYRDVRSYNIKEFTLIKAICKTLNLPRDSLTEKRLINWKQYAGRGVNLSAFCVEEISKRRSEQGEIETISIDKVNEKLTDLSKEASAKKWGFTGLFESPSFQYCMRNMTFRELKYFFDIILKARIIGGLEHKFLSCWHPNAQDYLGVVSDLKILSQKLWDPFIRLGRQDLTINIGHPFAPHLAKRLYITYEKASAKLKDDFFIEEKMDGERIQLHFMDRGSKIRFFSRRGTDYTHLYGKSLETGVISQFLKFREDVFECVLDGEMVSFDKERKVVLPFGVVKSAAVEEIINASTSIEKEGYRPLYMIFDLVYLNGTSLTKIPLHVRKEYLREIMAPVPNIVEILPELRAKESTAISTSLQRAIEMGSEGLILKQLNSTYDIGARNDFWIKIKPEYFEDLGETMDLIIIGRDPGKKDSLMCGLLETGVTDDQSDKFESEANGVSRKLKVLSFCNIANGVSDEEFKEIERKTRGSWHLFKEGPPPTDLIEFGNKLPIEWIDPQYSLVMEVKARSVDNNGAIGKKYKVGSTLHGAYCRRLREDKDWTTCATLEQFQQAKVAHNYYTYKNRANRVSVSRRKRLKVSKPSNVNDLNVPNIAKETALFEGMTFYILSDFLDPMGKRHDRNIIGEHVKKHGGGLIPNLTVRPEELSHLWVISGKNTIECKSLFDRGYDIIDPMWIFDSIASGSRLKLEPKHCFLVSMRLLENTKKRVDSNGDSFTRSVTNDDYMKIVEKTNLAVEMHGKQWHELEDAPLMMLQRYRIFVAASKENSAATKQCKKTVMIFGGMLVNEIENCNLVIACLASTSDDLFLRDLRSTVAATKYKENKKIGDAKFRIPRIVSLEWLRACVMEQCLVPEEDHICV